MNPSVLIYLNLAATARIGQFRWPAMLISGFDFQHVASYSCSINISKMHHFELQARDRETDGSQQRLTLRYLTVL